MNRILINGFLGRDAESIASKSGLELTKLSVADTYKDKAGKETTSWFSVTAFGKVAVGAKGLPKGTKVVVDGRMEESSYEKDGEKKKAWKVLANSIAVDVIARGASGGTVTPDAPRVEQELDKLASDMEIPF